MDTMKYKIISFWLVLFCILFVFLQKGFQYHFFYIEQSQLFQYSWFYGAEKIVRPGGFALLLSEYVMQFFILPYAGPAIVSALLVFAGFVTGRVVSRIIPSVEIFLLPLLPVVCLLFIHFDFNYRIFGTVAYDCMLLALWFYVSVNKYIYRLVIGVILSFLLFWGAGSVSLLFAVLVVIYELLSRTPRGYLSLFICTEVLLLGICGVYFSWIGEYRFTFLPDAYYHRNLEPKNVIYYSWICLPLILLVAFGLKNKKFDWPLKKRAVLWIGQLLVLGGLLYWGIPEFSDRKSIKLKELDYYARMEQWDNIVEACKGKLTNFLYLCYLNMALAEKGELADKMFYFDQKGPQGVMVAWNKSEQVSSLLNDVYFAMGYVAPAQEMAFEGYVSSMGYGNPRLLKRLIQTNLIYGAYPVAEKYISVLERTFYYKDWAQKQRKFLYNDAMIEEDPLLGVYRKCLPKNCTLAHVRSFEADLRLLAETNPSNKAAIEYLGGYYLLSKDMQGFKNLVETYYGTDILPILPVSFQEAVITLSEKETDYWKRFNVSDGIVRRFTEYKQAVLANKNNPASLPGLLNRSFGNTYWYYFMFK